ncbi:DUF4129 domain-containing protein [Glycomyces sp. NPDC047010]|uniref:DUF4129 domain-containing protein n=1 Tax=Glycomyces sp. NPDC047010 TaxID=3155023 RepID=UPI003403EDD3
MTPPAPPERPTLRRWLPVVAVAAALLIVGIAAQGTGLQWDEARMPFDGGGGVEVAPSMPTYGEPSLGLGDGGREGGSFPSWISWLILGVLAGVPLLLVLLLLVRRLLRWVADAPESTGVPEPEPEHLVRDFALVDDAIASALQEMDLGTDARSAIMACWIHFERAAEGVGIERDASDTPADLVRKLLLRHDLDGAALNRLTEAYLRARYSPHDVGEADRDRARDALVALRAQLGVREAQ